MKMACCCAAWTIVLPACSSGFSMRCIAQQPLCGVPYRRCLALGLSLSEADAVDGSHPLRGFIILKTSVARGFGCSAH